MSDEPSIPKRLIRAVRGGPSKQRRKKRPQAKSGQPFDGITPNPMRGGKREAAARKRAIKHLNHRGDWKGTEHPELVTVNCLKCGDLRTAELGSGGWKTCLTCGAKTQAGKVVRE
jgi:hypothetical protein